MAAATTQVIHVCKSRSKCRDFNALADLQTLQAFEGSLQVLKAHISHISSGQQAAFYRLHQTSQYTAIRHYYNFDDFVLHYLNHVC